MTYFAAPGIKGLKVYKNRDYETIIKLSGKFFNLAPQQILARCRRMDIVKARWCITFFLVKEKGIDNQSEIARALNFKSHASISNNLTALKDYCDTDETMKRILNKYINHMTSQL